MFFLTIDPSDPFFSYPCLRLSKSDFLLSMEVCRRSVRYVLARKLASILLPREVV